MLTRDESRTPEKLPLTMTIINNDIWLLLVIMHDPDTTKTGLLDISNQDRHTGKSYPVNFGPTQG